VAVASAGRYANLHLAQTDNHARTPLLSFFYWPDALHAAQLHQRNRTLIRNRMQEVEATGQRGNVQPPKMAETTPKPSSVPLQKHSPGGFTIDMPTSNWRISFHRLVCTGTELAVQR